MRRILGRLVSGVIALCLVAVGCTTDESSNSTPSSTEPTTTIVRDETTHSVDKPETWDLVWISDRWAGQPEGLPVTATLLADRIEGALDVEVLVDDHVELGLHASTVLDRLSNEASQLASSVAEAEVIVFWADPVRSGIREDYSTCLFDFLSERNGPGDPFVAYTVEDFAPYREVLKSIHQRMLELRDGAPTIIRVYDVHVTFGDEWEAAGIGAECWGFFDLLSQTVKEVAAEFGIPTASVLDAFNGVDRSEDPFEKGYVGAGDFHLSRDGQAALVDLLHELGYEPIPLAVVDFSVG